MEKKVFLNRGLMKTAKRPGYIKLLLCAAVALIVLVIWANLLMRKPQKEVAKKPEASKGMLVKEIPRTGSYDQEVAPTEAQIHGELRRRTEAEAPLSEQPMTEPGNTDKAAPAPQAEQSKQLAAGTGPGQSATQAHPSAPSPAGVNASDQGNTADKGKEQPAPFKPYDFAMQSKAVAPDKNPVIPTTSTPGGAPAGAGVTTQPDKAAKAMPASSGSDAGGAAKIAHATTKAKAEKPAPSGKELFAVQLGSFKEKDHAERLQLGLQKKGYSVIVKTFEHPTLGRLYVVRLAGVSDMSKAETLKMQISHEANVKPSIIRVPSHE
jgi:cell division septation protein DedD